MVVDYVTTMAHTAMDHATGRDGKMQPEDVLYLVRKASNHQPPFLRSFLMLGPPGDHAPAQDRATGLCVLLWQLLSQPAWVVQDPQKFARATELLRLNEEIKQARKVCDAVWTSYKPACFPRCLMFCICCMSEIIYI